MTALVHAVFVERIGFALVFSHDANIPPILFIRASFIPEACRT